MHNLDFTITKEGILRTFAVYGRIKHINFPFDNRNRPRGLAFVIYATHVDAARALKAGMRGIILGTRKLRVEIYKPLERLNAEKKEKAKISRGEGNEEEEGLLRSAKPVDRLKRDSPKPEDRERYRYASDSHYLERSLSPERRDYRHTRPRENAYREPREYKDY